MKSIEATTKAFVIRIWLEHRPMKSAQPIWRGVIERVDNGERVYFDELDKISDYFAKCLTDLGINPRNLKK